MPLAERVAAILRAHPDPEPGTVDAAPVQDGAHLLKFGTFPRRQLVGGGQ